MRPYGQHFLRCEDIAKEIARKLNARAGDVVVEIGCGKGFLTKFVAQAGCKIVCYEVDASLKEEFTKNVPFENVEFRLKDFLEVKSEELQGAQLCYGSIPYQISSKIIRKLIELGLRTCLLIVQKEFAEKLVLGRDKYKRTFMTILSQTYFDITILRRVTKTCFEPPPRVDSALIELRRKNVQIDLDSYERFLRKLFQRPNKIVKTVLKEIGLDGFDISPTKRVRDLSVQDVLNIYLRWLNDQRRTF